MRRLPGTWALEFGIAWLVIGVLAIVPTVLLLTAVNQPDYGWSLAAASGSMIITGLLCIVLDITTLLAANLVVAIGFTVSFALASGVAVWMFVSFSIASTVTIAAIVISGVDLTIGVIFFLSLTCKHCYGKCYAVRVDPDWVAEHPVVLWLDKLEDVIQQKELADGRILIGMVQKTKEHLREGKLLEADDCYAKLRAIFTIPIADGPGKILPLVQPLMKEIQAYFDVLIKQNRSRPSDDRERRPQIEVGNENSRSKPNVKVNVNVNARDANRRNRGKNARV